eukprot:gene2487-3239_t
MATARGKRTPRPDVPGCQLTVKKVSLGGCEDCDCACENPSWVCNPWTCHYNDLGYAVHVDTSGWQLVRGDGCYKNEAGSSAVWGSGGSGACQLPDPVPNGVTAGSNRIRITPIYGVAACGALQRC